MHCLIIDDDPLICDLLNHFCQKVDAISSTTVTNSGFEAVNLINQESFDLILLDYNLPDITGREILELVGMDSMVIMITNNKNFAHEAYDYDQIVDFLVKPIDFVRFARGIKKAQKFSKKNEEATGQLFIKDGTKLVKVDLNQVLYIKSAANYAQLILGEKKIMTLMTLKELEDKLPTYFQRVHRSYIVNVNKIESIANDELIINNEKISIGDSYGKELYGKINLLK